MVELDEASRQRRIRYKREALENLSRIWDMVALNEEIERAEAREHRLDELALFMFYGATNNG